jgi:hypothetical protein
VKSDFATHGDLKPTFHQRDQAGGCYGRTIETNFGVHVKLTASLGTSGKKSVYSYWFEVVIFPRSLSDYALFPHLIVIGRKLMLAGKRRLRY